MTDTANAVPTSIRRVDSANATRLAQFVAAYDDLQTTLRCCERLMTMLGADPNTPKTTAAPDDLGVEALWTLALLCYARAFAAEGDAEAAVTENDLDDAAGDGEVLKAHRVLLHLRDHQSNPTVNPREVYTVGVAQDDTSGAVIAVAVTSVHSPVVDVAAVQQAGSIAFPLCASLDGRISALQEVILDEVKDTPKAQLDAMDVIEVSID